MASGISLKELAAELKLAPSTVSRALNDSYEISEATKKKVISMAEKMNYHANPFARSLRENKSKTIAVIIPERINNFFAQVMDGIEEIAQEHGYHLLVYNTKEDVEKEKKIVNLLLNGRADAIAMSVSSQTSDVSHLKKLHDRGLPIIFFDRICDEIATTKFITNDHQSAYEGTKHLIQQGCKKIAFLMLSKELSITKERYRGYLDAIKEVGWEPKPAFSLNCCYDEKNNVELIRELLSSEDRPDGIMASVEKLAFATYEAVRHTDLSVPKDLKVISFSNSSIVGLLNPSLTTITQPAIEMGNECANMLIRKLAKPKYYELMDKVITIPSKITVRESTSKG
ncbi:LacI family DNA-binding transcriptional regulator [Algoriphagus halophytocola]|uniref:LacI family transcriptional regulator n=1 Tax=Algoriphagus halophytocola TaxID=2991499 RepID=A0ABY6MH45_9BACT|nr:MULTISPECIES: LacI family DNA-binding transcriptional regulator [unclassified Algoriphagus]UZD23112.1 LacI family transcriptional regulator [Algoriphagus sp. TR-M5]WBL44404.1 LacI family DNA-binding transcriptional regulator [Algoriphagus sp. TR-M9]